MSGYITKGARIRAEWFGDARPVPLAGMQMKVQATKFTVVGVVRHFRGDDPVAPKVIRIYVDPDHPWEGRTVRPEGCTCDHEHVEVNPDHVVAHESTV
jgi:hypothetical protein